MCVTVCFSLYVRHKSPGEDIEFRRNPKDAMRGHLKVWRPLFFSSTLGRGLPQLIRAGLTMVTPFLGPRASVLKGRWAAWFVASWLLTYLPSQYGSWLKGGSVIDPAVASGEWRYSKCRAGSDQTPFFGDSPRCRLRQDLTKPLKPSPKWDSVS